MGALGTCPVGPPLNQALVMSRSTLFSKMGECPGNDTNIFTLQDFAWPSLFLSLDHTNPNVENHLSEDADE